MASIHLNVMELERYGQSCLEPTFVILAPHYHRIAELISILVDNAVEFRLNHGRCADNHVVFKERTFTFSRCMHCQLLIITIKLLQVIRIRNVARTDITFAILHDDIDGKPIELEQSSPTSPSAWATTSTC